jgi:hypothetical protein
MKCYTIGISMIILLHSVVCGQDPDRLLSGLRDSERLEVWFSGRGRDGAGDRRKYFLRFEGTQAAVFSVTESKEGIMTKHPVGSCDLTREQVEQIDRLFMRYRSSDGGDWIAESLSVEVWRGERRVSKEILVTPGWPKLDFEGEMRIYDVIEMATPQPPLQ